MRTTGILGRIIPKMASIGTLLVGLLLLCAITACSRVTQENYDRLKVGMEYSQAVSLLGEPQECSAVLNAKNCTWGDDKKSIQAKIVADKVVWLSSKGLK